MNFDKKIVQSLSKRRLPSLKQLKHAPKFFSPFEAKLINSLWFVIFVCLIFLGVNFYLTNVKYLPKQGGEYTEGLVGYPAYINPILSQANDVDMDISNLLFSRLLTFDKDLNLTTELAEKYEISEDQKEYVFYLKKNIVWQDSEMFNADDVIFTFNKILDSDIKSPLFITFQGVVIEKIDDYTVKFKLEKPFAPFLSTLTFGILPEHLWQNINSNNFHLAELNLKPIGNGPFIFKSLVKDKNGSIKSYTLARNENYFGPKPYFDTIVFKFYPSFESAIDAYKNKNILGISYLPKDLSDKLKNEPDSQRLFDLPQYTALFINQKTNKNLLSKEIRQAVAYAIDRDKIISDVLKNLGEKTDSPILKGYIGHNPDIKKYEFNQQKAKDLLEKEGWKLGQDNIRIKNKINLEITITTVDKPEYSQTADLIKKDLENIGIKTNISLIHASSFYKDIIKPRNYEILLYSENIGADPDPYPFWHSSQMVDPGLSLSIFTDKKVDTLLEEARNTTNQDERAGKYKEFQNILADELPAIFLYNSKYTYILSSKIQGLNLNRINIPSDRFINITEWYIKTKKSF